MHIKKTPQNSVSTIQSSLMYNTEKYVSNTTSNYLLYTLAWLNQDLKELIWKQKNTVKSILAVTIIELFTCFSSL